MLKEELKQLKGENNLKDEVINYIIDYHEDDEEIINFIEDLSMHGCQSGMVSDLIYYNDTVEFYNKHKEEINNLLYNMLEYTGLSIKELFGNKWDDKDPSVIETTNKNLLAWFAFEETTRNIARELDIDY